jgi:hypothetical protein
VGQQAQQQQQQQQQHDIGSCRDAAALRNLQGCSSGKYSLLLYTQKPPKHAAPSSETPQPAALLKL